MGTRKLPRFLKQAKSNLNWILHKSIISNWLMVPYLLPHQRARIAKQNDPIRYGTVYLALEDVLKNKIPGAFAECGVYQGEMSKFVHEMGPERRLYLFDTFEGFDLKDSNTYSDNRFKDTSVDRVMKYIGGSENIIVKKGYFPGSADGIANERFAFVMIDFDKYEPVLAALEIFYNLVNPGGYIFIHDYNSPESDWACSRALTEFLADKPEKSICIPDSWGTALFRKI
jgi:O-methyltransferase